MNKNTSETPWMSSVAIHGDLLATKELVYNPCGVEYSQPLLEAQNAEKYKYEGS